ncbi:MAG: DUF4112 domain-containing protein [Phormidesmis sp. RL_2_1]|nr:DUF4112 domain-containing protein [Phormidesmis sp. RL_2_1]
MKRSSLSASVYSPVIHQRIKRLRHLSHLLDNAIALPGSDFRIGLDPLLGILPGGGDVITGLISVYIVWEGARMGLPAATLGRMGVNILLDTLTGTVPVLGDLFDVTWKANSQNVALLEKHLAQPQPSRAADRLFAMAMVAGLLTLVLGVAALSLWMASQLFSWLQPSG